MECPVRQAMNTVSGPAPGQFRALSGWGIAGPGFFRLSLATIVVLSHLSKLAIGTAAVELFFALSGFWIYRLYDRKYSRTANPGLVFVTSRMMRLLPVFLLFNFACLALHFHLHDKVAAGTRLRDMLPNFIIIGYAGLPEKPMVPAWSLDIELQFYLLFPLLFPLIKWMRGMTGAAVCAAALCLGGAYMAVVLHDDSTLVLPYMGFFLLGVFAAKSNAQPSRALVSTGASIAIVGLAVVVALPSLRGIAMHTIDDRMFPWNRAFNFVFALLLTPLALSSVHQRSGSRDRMLGDLSFTVYCSHWLAKIIGEHYLSNLSRMEKAPAVVLLLVITYAASVWLLIRVDRPINRWRERWVASQQGAPSLRAPRPVPTGTSG